MRSLFLAVIIAIGLGITLTFPFAGILLWTWFTCMDPHQEAYGFVTTAPINQIIVGVTVVAWLASRERKLPPNDATITFIVLFLIWMTINSFFAVDPGTAWPVWDRTWKTIVLGIFVAILTTNRVRVHALVWVVAVSLLYYGIKGGIFTLITGGHNHVEGPPNSIIGDNNQLALALLMVLPLLNYLRQWSANRWASTGFAASIPLMFFSILGSYSRGAFLALGALAVAAWFRSRNKLAYLAAAIVVAVPAFYFMPQSYYDRLSTIQSADTDDSFQGRVMAWQVAWRYASEHFPFGDGFYNAQLPQVFNRYFPNQQTHAAHSIYFEVLGDNGYPGLALYLGILILSFVNCARIRRMTRGDPEQAWAYDLAGMIQLSLFVFCIGGAALSMAYYDVFFILSGLLCALRSMLAKEARSGNNAESAAMPLPAGLELAK